MGEGTELAIVLVAKDLASETLKGVGEKFHGMGEAGKLAMAGIAAAGAAAIAGVGTLVAMADGAAHAADEVRKLTRETGLSAEAASGLHFAGEKLNIDNDALSKSFGIFSKTIELHADTLKKLHVEVIKTKDGHVDLEGTIEHVADQFKKMPDGVEKTALAMQLFGKSGKDMIPLLNQGSAGLKEMGADAAKMGLVFSGQGLEAARQYGLAQKELGERFEGMKNTIGMAVVPILTKVFGILAEAADKIIPPLLAGFGVMVQVFGNLVDAIHPVLEVATAFGSLWGDALSGTSFEADGLAETWTKVFGQEMPQQLYDFTNNVSVAVAGVTNFFNDLRARVQEVFDRIAAILRPFIEMAMATLSKFWTEIQPKLAAAFASIGEKVQFVVNNIIVPVVTFLAQFWQDHLQQIAQVAMDVFGVIVGVIKVAWDVISGVFRVALDLISGNWQGAWDDMVGMVRGAWDDLSHIFDTLKDFAGNLASMAMDLGKSIVQGILDGLGGLASALWNAFTNALNSIHIDVGPFHLSSAGMHVDMPNLHFPGFAEGGVVPGAIGAPMLAVVHGGEIVTPPGRSSAGGAQITINIGSVDSQRRVDEVSQALYRAYRLSGGRL